MDIKFGHKVSEVHYSPGDVRVVATANGKKVEFTADAIVSTVSLGVLKSDTIRFEPALPQSKV